jgi:D-alanyl-D-alanine carboxypeptidase/D-alanyl-D-alanine-endopeptidase (penicillin-binding protein 4)
MILIDARPRPLLSALLALAIAAPAAAQAPDAPLPTPRPEVAAAAPRAADPARAGEGARLTERYRLTGGMGFIVMDARTGEVLEAMNADEPFAPASVAKIPTALYAIETLGPDHRFETQVVAEGRIEDRRLRGDLALVGGGDPELDSADVAALAATAAAAIDRVDGMLLARAGAVAAMIDDDQPPQAAYNPAVAALNLNFNRVRLKWTNEGGRLAWGMEAHAVGWSPEVRSIAAIVAPDECRCASFTHGQDDHGEVWRVREGNLRGEGGVWLPVRDPAGYAVEVFAAAVERAGVARQTARAETGAIRPTLAATPAANGPATVLASRYSRPLREVARDMLRHSTNLTAETLGVAAAVARGAPVVGLFDSAADMNAWAAERAGFAAGEDFRLMNHSGLSAESRVSARRMGEFLVAAAQGDAPFGEAGLAALLPQHPIDEQNARAPRGSRVLAKTGTMDFTRGLAGYAVAPSGRVLAFAIFANDLERRAATRGHDGPPPGARPWRDTATAQERALLRSWLARFD